MSASTTHMGPQGLFDHPLPVILRTPRELLGLAVGLAAVAAELRQSDNHWLPVNLTVIAVGMLLFASRLFFARYVGIAAAVGALACGVSYQSNLWAGSLSSRWRAWVLVGTLVLLSSRDLAQRFDRSPSSLFGLWRNPLAVLDDRDLRLVRWTLYCLVIPMSVLVRAEWDPNVRSGVALVEPLAVAFLLVGVAILLGRFRAMLLLPPLALCVLIQLVPDTVPVTPSGPQMLGQLMERGAWRPLLLTASAALVLSTRLAWRQLRGQLR